MSLDWLSSKRPLDVIARGIEDPLVATGRATDQGKDVSEWGKDPKRAAVMRTMFGVLAGGGETTSNERHVQVDERYVQVVDPEKNVFAYGPSTREDDAAFLSRPWENPTPHKSTVGNPKESDFIEDAKRFALTVKSKPIVEEDLPRLLEACEVTTNVKYAVVGKRKVVITLSNRAMLPLIRPRFVPCLPLPSTRDKPDWRCTASGATWQAMLGLTRAFGRTRPPTVLVTGPPGSGKEAYARAVHFGQKRNRGRTDEAQALVTLSLAELGARELRARLEGELLGRLNNQRGTLFLDEVDKASSEVRSYLLRILENRKYENAWREEQACDAVAFVVAAGKPLAALRGMEPPDFWTRMEVHISVADPLTAGSQQERERLLKAFFKFFWWDMVSDWLDGYRDVLAAAPTSPRPWPDLLRDSKFLTDNLFPAAIGSMNEHFEFKPSAPVERAAEHFAGVLAPHLERRQLSVRGLRTAVGAVQRATRSQLAGMAIVPNHSARDEFEEVAEGAIYEAVGTVLQVLPDDNEMRGRPRA